MRFLIVEDHPLFVEGLRAALAELPQRPVLECAADCRSAIEAVKARPDFDLILLDIGLPDADGRALVRILRGQDYRGPILVITASENLQQARELLESEVQGYVLKSSPMATLLKAIQRVLRGERYLPEQWQDLMNTAAARPELRLTARQLDVLYLMAQGHSNKVIAAWLGVSEHTVKTHVQALFDTLGVRNRTACVREAERLGLIGEASGGTP